MEELKREFVIEARKYLQIADEQLAALQREQAMDTARLFSALHIIKGGAGLLQLQKPEELSSGLEDVVGRIRDGTLDNIGEQVIEALLSGVARLREIIEDLDGQLDIEAELTTLQRL